MHCVYILQSNKTGKHYIGSTNNFERRIKEHNTGINISTRNKGVFKLIYKEEFSSRSEAYRRELQIKSYKGGIAFRRLIGK